MYKPPPLPKTQRKECVVQARRWEKRMPGEASEEQSRARELSKGSAKNFAKFSLLE